MKQAELAARNELQPIVAGFSRKQWQQAVGSSGTIRALAEIAAGQRLRRRHDHARRRSSKLRATLDQGRQLRARSSSTGIRPDRVPVLPGGLAILIAVLSELDIDEMTPATRRDARRPALRSARPRASQGHARRHRRAVHAALSRRRRAGAARRRARAVALQEARPRTRPTPTRSDRDYIGWAAKLHEIGISVAYSGYHKHSAYILEKADMPGFSRDEQTQLALLALAHRRSLKKIAARIEGAVDWRAVLALRLAALFYRGRADLPLPALPGEGPGQRVQARASTPNGSRAIRSRRPRCARKSANGRRSASS